MMKKGLKAILLIVIAAAAVTGCAGAGTGSSEAASSTGYDASKHVGKFMTWPDNDSACPADTDNMSVFFEKDDVEAGDGHIGVYEADTDKKFADIDVTDTDACNFEAATDMDKKYTSWSGGTTCNIKFGKCLKAEKKYYVTWDKGTFILKSDKSIKTRAITKDDDISFYVAPYGVARNDGKTGSASFDGRVGDTIKLNVMTDGKYVSSAKAVDYDKDMIGLSDTEFTGSSSTLEIKLLKAGSASLTLYYYDKDNEGYTYSIYYFDITD